MFTFSHPLLIEELIGAHQRGVDVTVAVDYYTGRGAGALALQTLSKGGIKVFLSQGQQLLHHKWMVVDNSLLLGSANWTKAAFSVNQDFFLLLHPLSSDQKKYLKKLCHIIRVEANDASMVI